MENYLMGPQTHKLKPGEVPEEQFALLLAGTSIRSTALIAALRDHLVNGVAPAKAWTMHSINPSQFSRRLSVLQDESDRAKALSVFYQGR